MTSNFVTLTLAPTLSAVLLMAASISCEGQHAGTVDVMVPASLSGAEATVLFFDAQGSLLSRTRTENGLATGPMRPGGSVLAVNPGLLYAQVLWTLDVQPGDTLTIQSYSFFYGPATNAQVGISPVPPGTTKLYFSSPCTSFEPWVQTENVSVAGVYDINVCGYPFDILLAAHIEDGVDALPPLIAVMRGVQPDAFHDALLEPTWLPPNEFKVSLGGDPEVWKFAEFKFDAVTDGERRFGLPPEFRRFGRDGDGASLTLPWIPELGAQGVLSARIPEYGTDSTHQRTQILARRFEDVSTGVTFDIGELQLPTIDDVTFSRAGVSWRVAGDEEFDGMMINYSSWLIIAPPGTTRLARPKLPPDMEQLWPENTLAVTIRQLKEDGIPDWASMRTMSWAELSGDSESWVARSRYRAVSETQVRLPTTSTNQ